MNVVDKPLRPNCWFHDPAPPREIDGILMHFTVGQSASSAWYTFQGAPANIGYPEGTPYVIDVNGDVWKLFDEGAGYSYHIGCSGAWAMNHKHDKRLIGIEIANIGPLELGKDGKSLLWNGGRTLFGKLDDLRCPPFVKLEVPFRGYEYFAAFPEAQIKAAVELADSLQTRWKFPRIIPPLKREVVDKTNMAVDVDCRFGYDEAFFADRKGVVSHVNFRSSGKWDQSPTHSDALWAGLIADGWTEQA